MLIKQNREYCISDEIKIAVLTVIIIFGEFLKIPGIRILGIVPTINRIGIPLMAAYYLLKRFFVDIRDNKFKFSKEFIIFEIMLLFWLIYGAFAIVISTYSPLNEGAKELLSIFLGILSIYCVYETCNSDNKIILMLKYLKLSCVILCAIALVEMFTGIHMSTSMYMQQPFVFFDNKIIVIGLYVKKLFPATSIFFNVNDFSVLLSILSPLFFYNKSQKLSEKIVNIITLFVILLIFSVNDANISFIGLFFGMIVYLILNKKSRLQFSIIIVASICCYQWISNWVCKVLIIIKSCIWRKSVLDKLNDADITSALSNMDAVGLDNSSGLSNVVSSQIHNAALGSGSLFLRLNLALDSLELFIKTYGLGIGPAGFMEYYKKNQGRTYLVNPHNWWLEVLSQYGIFVFVFYVISLIKIYIKLIKLFSSTKKQYMLIVIAMCSVFMISCLAPSNFLGYNYLWLLPALAITILSVNQERSN